MSACAEADVPSRIDALLEIDAPEGGSESPRRFGRSSKRTMNEETRKRIERRAEEISTRIPTTEDRAEEVLRESLGS